MNIQVPVKGSGRIIDFTAYRLARSGSVRPLAFDPGLRQRRALTERETAHRQRMLRCLRESSAALTR